MLHVAEHDKELDTYKLGGTTLITHLVFIDDLLIFTKANKKSLETKKHTLVEYVTFFGLHANPQKSTVVLLASCGDKDALIGILGFPQNSFPIRHIGITLVSRNLRWL